MNPKFQDVKYPHADLVSVTRGFADEGKTLEFVEFRPYNSNIKFVAQLSPGIWLAYVYKVWPGKKGTVLTMDAFGNFGGGMGHGYRIPQVAADAAFKAALKIAQG